MAMTMTMTKRSEAVEQRSEAVEQRSEAVEQRSKAVEQRSEAVEQRSEAKIFKSIYLLAENCASLAGPTSEDLWSRLLKGDPIPQSRPGVMSTWIKKPGMTSRQSLVAAMRECYEKASANLDIEKKLDVSKDRQGLIVASTKGCVEDDIWLKDLDYDPVESLLMDFCPLREFSEAISLSHACTSFVAALELARDWMLQDRVDGVWIITCDEVGPFVEKGFSSLRALSNTQPRPFSENRDGLCLGEAVVAVYVTTRKSCVEVVGVCTDTEGFAVTRPDASGESLLRCCEAVFKNGFDVGLSRNEANPDCGIHGKNLDFIIAHGTATQVNDEIEDRVFNKLGGKPLITATKWLVGHSLASSAAVDFCMASWALKKKELFPISSTKVVDPNFRGNYLLSNSKESSLVHREFNMKNNKALVTSLGFGGVHGAVLLEISRE